MKVRTVRVSQEGRVSVGRKLAGKQYECTVHDDGRIELHPVYVLRRDELPESALEAIDQLSGRRSAVEA